MQGAERTGSNSSGEVPGSHAQVDQARGMSIHQAGVCTYLFQEGQQRMQKPFDPEVSRPLVDLYDSNAEIKSFLGPLVEYAISLHRKFDHHEKELLHTVATDHPALSILCDPGACAPLLRTLSNGSTFGCYG
jgi:hypothetical protein